MQYCPANLNADLSSVAYGINASDIFDIENQLAGKCWSASSLVVYGKSLEALAAIERNRT